MELRRNFPLLSLDDDIEDLPVDKLGRTFEDMLQSKREVDSSFQTCLQLARSINDHLRKVDGREDREKGLPLYPQDIANSNQIRAAQHSRSFLKWQIEPARLGPQDILLVLEIGVILLREKG